MLKTAPLQIRAYEHLREMIEENQLEDGVIYSETRLAKEIGVSRTPMRDALQKLEQEGLIEILPSRGFQLQAITPERIQKNNQVRSALECYSAVVLTRNFRTPKAQESIRRLGELLGLQRKVFEEDGEISEFVRYDLQFHRTVVESLENEELSKLFCNHIYCIQKLARKSLLHTGRLEATLREHTAIYDAIRTGDLLNIYDITMQHMEITTEINLIDLKEG